MNTFSCFGVQIWCSNWIITVALIFACLKVKRKLGHFPGNCLCKIYSCVPSFDSGLQFNVSYNISLHHDAPPLHFLTRNRIWIYKYSISMICVCGMNLYLTGDMYKSALLLTSIGFLFEQPQNQLYNRSISLGLGSKWQQTASQHRILYQFAPCTLQIGAGIILNTLNSVRCVVLTVGCHLQYHAVWCLCFGNAWQE